MRKILQESSSFFKYFSEMEILPTLFDIITVSRRGSGSKKEKIEKMEENTKSLMKVLSEGTILEKKQESLNSLSI